MVDKKNKSDADNKDDKPGEESLIRRILSRKEIHREPVAFKREKENAEEYLDDKKKLKGLNSAVSDKIEKTQKKIKSGLDDFYTLMRLVAAYAQGEYRQVSKKTMIAVVAALLYFLSPIDLIPDFIAFFGYLDDLSILAYVMRTFKIEIDRFIVWEMAGGDVEDEKI